MSITPESVEALLNSQDFGDRLRGVNHIRSLDPALGFGLARLAIQDSNARVRYAAVSQMSSLGTQDLAQATTILRDRLDDSEPDVQAAAADSIGALKLTEVFEDLQQLYHNTPEWLVKFSIVAALGELGDRRAFELLQDALHSDNELLQTAAIGSLGELGDERGVALIIPFATHADWQIRLRVAQGLGNLNAAEGRSTLETLTHDEVEQIAEEAQRLLALG